MQLSAPTPRLVVTPPRTATQPVDIDPMRIYLRPDLALSTPDPQGRSYVSAASGIATAPNGGSTYVVSDDLFDFARFDSIKEPGTLVTGLAPAKKKADLESVIYLPNDRWGAPPIIYAHGSGSSSSRDRGVVYDVDAKGATVRNPRTVDLAPLHAALAKRLPQGVNIEGMALRDGAKGRELLLFHRGQEQGDRNVIFTLDGIEAIAAIRNGAAIPPSALRSELTIDLGQLGGSPLGFADARALPDGRIAFIASAEGPSGPNGDGAILGSVVGTLDADLKVTSLRPLAGVPRKAEGIEIARRLDPTADANDVVLVTDPDDPSKAAEVLTVSI